MPSGGVHPIRFWRERSFMVVDGNDRVWSALAGKADCQHLGIKNRALSVRQGSFWSDSPSNAANGSAARTVVGMPPKAMPNHQVPTQIGMFLRLQTLNGCRVSHLAFS